MDDERAALIVGIQRQIAAIARHPAAQQRPLAPLPPPPQRRSATGVLDTLLFVLLMLCVLVFLVICWRLLGDYRAIPSNRDTAFVVVALFLAGTLFGWWMRGTRR
jgi:ferric-dicitrate binding protein FerR (iron transport regulator)